MNGGRGSPRRTAASLAAAAGVLLVGLLVLAALALASSGPNLVKDINPGGGTSNPYDLTDVSRDALLSGPRP